MNVLIVPSWYTIGADAQLGAFFREQALALKQSGVNVIVADATLQGREQIVSKRNFKMLHLCDEGIDTYSYTTPSFGLMRVTAIGEVLYYLNLRRICKKIWKDGIKVDVIHAHSIFPAGYAAVKIAKKYKIPLVVTEHASSVLAKKIDKRKVLYLKKCVEEADVFICVSNALKDAVMDYTNSIKPIYVIPNMVDKRFEYLKKEREKSFTFVSIGNLLHSKRFDLTIEAFKIISKEFPNVFLKIIGDGILKEKLYQQACKLGIESRITFMGRITRSEVVKELQRADVFVLPSDFETFGVVYIEALACGVPVIATKNGGADDIITSEDGYLIDVGNLQQLEEAMREVYLSYESFSRVNLSRRCLDKFGENVISKQLKELYNDVVGYVEK